MKNFLFFFCSAMLSWAVSAGTDNFTPSQSSDPIKKLVRAIAKANVYEITSAKAQQQSPFPQKNRLDQLLATADTLLMTNLITNHNNPVVRLYAFKALVILQKSIPKSIIDRVMNDGALVTVTDGNKKEKLAVKDIAKGFLY